MVLINIISEKLNFAKFCQKEYRLIKVTLRYYSPGWESITYHVPTYITHIKLLRFVLLHFLYATL